MTTHSSSSFIQGHLRPFVAFFLFIQFARSLVIQPGNFSLAAAHKEDVPHCVDSPLWEYRGDQESDCLAAIRMLHDTEVHKHGDHEFEFVPDGDHPHLSLAITKTPRKYISSESPIFIFTFDGHADSFPQRILHLGDCQP